MLTQLRRILALVLLATIPAPYVMAALAQDDEASHCGCSEGVCRCAHATTAAKGGSCHASGRQDQLRCNHPRPETTLPAAIAGVLVAVRAVTPPVPRGPVVVALRSFPADGFPRTDLIPPRDRSR